MPCYAMMRFEGGQAFGACRGRQERRRPFRHHGAADRRRLARLRIAPACPLSSTFALWGSVPGPVEGVHRPAAGLRIARRLADCPPLPPGLAPPLSQAAGLAALADRPLAARLAD